MDQTTIREIERLISKGQSIQEYPGILAHGDVTWDPQKNMYSMVLGLPAIDINDGLGQFSVTFDLSGTITTKEIYKYTW